jgi:transcription antitermination protein NusB
VNAGARRPDAGRRARSLARRLALQALYQMQLNDLSWQVTHRQYAAGADAERVDRRLLPRPAHGDRGQREALDGIIARLSEIPPAELDPIEHAVLWLGVHEMQHCPELPFRVVIAEAVQLTRQFGATDGHKFVNAVLDRAAQELRPLEYGAPR